MQAFDFVHQTFYASNWESQLKEFIKSIKCPDNTIWHRMREYKKINEELSVMGYYVKYRFGEDKAISFKLNDKQGDQDGWIYQNDNPNPIESVQITIAFYEKEEFLRDRSIMNGSYKPKAQWIGDRINQLRNRVLERVKKKLDLNYQNINTLLIGVREWSFVRGINTEYCIYKDQLVKSIESCIQNSNFEQIVLVDSDLVGEGEFLLIQKRNIGTMI